MNLSVSWNRLGVILLAVYILMSSPLEAGYLGSYKQGRRAFDQKKWEQAVDHFRQALEEKEETGEMVRLYGVKMEAYLPRFYLGMALYELGEYREALEHWEESLEQRMVVDTAQHKLLLEARKQAEERVTAPPFSESGSQIAERPPDETLGQVIKSSNFDPVEELRLSGNVVDLGLSESFALVVGVSDYRDRGAWPSLPGVLRDVQEVRDALRRHGFRVQLLQDPTKRQLVDAMEDFFFTASRTEASRLLFYYAGHGATVAESSVPRGYLVPVDAPSPELDPRGFRRRSVSMARFQEYADESPARHIAFLFDSCFSGSVFEVVRSAVARGSVREKIKEKSRTFIAAGDADQEVPDQSYFRRAFVEALEGEADANGDGVIFGIELGQYISDTVIDQFYLSKNPQTPRWGRSGDYSKGDFPLQSPVGVLGRSEP